MFLAYLITHYFIPHHTNNQKAKLLHTSTFLFLIFSLIAYQIILRAIPFSGIKILGYSANVPPTEVISLTNLKREQSGLLPLKENPILKAAAYKKGQDMLDRDYWAHVAPDGTQPWGFFVDAGYKYRYAGENLARDFADPASAIDAWMASPTHRENMLSSKYKEIGIAVVEGDLGGLDTTIIVQFFGTQYADTTPQLPIARAETSVAAKVPSGTPAPAAQALTPTQAPTTFVSAPSEPVQAAKKPNILISPFDTTKNISLLTVVLLLGILIVDALIVSRRKIARIGGRTFAHLAFLGMVLAIIVITRAGAIL